MQLTLAPSCSCMSAGAEIGPCLQDCLKAFTSSEELDGEEAHQCDRCRARRPATKALRISRCPPLLVLHLKRFTLADPADYQSALEKACCPLVPGSAGAAPEVLHASTRCKLSERPREGMLCPVSLAAAGRPHTVHATDSSCSLCTLQPDSAPSPSQMSSRAVTTCLQHGMELDSWIKRSRIEGQRSSVL